MHYPDLSFSGAKVIVPGIGKFLMRKASLLRFELRESVKQISLEGTIVRVEAVAGRKDLAAAAVHFDEARVPYSYKLMINGFLNANRGKGKAR